MQKAAAVDGKNFFPTLEKPGKVEMMKKIAAVTSAVRLEQS